MLTPRMAKREESQLIGWIYTYVAQIPLNYGNCYLFQASLCTFIIWPMDRLE
jgi:hypothetical protein